MVRAVVLALLLSVVHSSSATAQEEPSPTRIVLPLDLWADLAKSKGDAGILRISIEGADCGGFGMDARINSHYTEGGDPFWTPTNPACLREGASIDLFMSSGERLAFQAAMSPGKDITITSVDFEPRNPDGATLLAVVDFPHDDSPTRLVRYLDVTADWKDCGRIDLVNPAERNADGYIVHRLDAKGLPPECSNGGTKIRLLKEGGGAFWQKPQVIEHGTTYQFEFGPEPPHGWPSRPLPRPAFWWLPWAMAGGVVALVTGAFTLSRVRRHRRGN